MEVKGDSLLVEMGDLHLRSVKRDSLMVVMGDHSSKDLRVIHYLLVVQGCLAALAVPVV